VALEPLDFLGRLAALVPPPRMHLTRYHGVFAPHHALRVAITPAGRGRGSRDAETPERPVSEHVAMSWAQRLERVFAIDIESCRRCGGKLRMIADIEAPALIERILAHLEQPPKDNPPFAVCPACTAAAVAAVLIIVRWSSEPARTAGRSSEALRPPSACATISGENGEKRLRVTVCSAPSLAARSSLPHPAAQT
jgi:hypothetical protein